MFRKARKIGVRTRIGKFALCLLTYGLTVKAQTKIGDPSAGQTLFASTCAACHGLDGRGGEHAPNIATDARIRSMSNAALLKIIQNGVPAAGMPGFAASLSEVQIRPTLAYLRSLQATERVPLWKQGTQAAAAGCLPGLDAPHAIWWKAAAACSVPDLTGYANNHSAAGILESILTQTRNLIPAVDWSSPSRSRERSTPVSSAMKITSPCRCKASMADFTYWIKRSCGASNTKVARRCPLIIAPG